jgi:hypothetical protein
MTAPSTPGSYAYTVWCDRGDKSTGQAKSTTYTITVQATPAPTAAITTLTPNHGLTGTSVVIAGRPGHECSALRRHHRLDRRLERDSGHRHGARSLAPAPTTFRDACRWRGLERAQLHRGRRRAAAPDAEHLRNEGSGPAAGTKGTVIG